MDWLIYLFGSGLIFFIGVGGVFLALLLIVVGKKRWQKIAATLVAIIGPLLITLSATPLPYWLYAIAGGVTLVWLVAERLSSEKLERKRKWLRASVTAMWIICLAVEVPFHFIPNLVASGSPTFYIIGDSVTAGMRDGESKCWPELLARDHPIEVVNLARMGATCSTAMIQADKLPADGGLLLLEIGGNDLLGSTSAEKYGRDLEQLLAKVCTANRTVAMFELPLPPFCNEYGRIQRSLAAKHGVTLIPKRVFITVLATSGATVDSIHLAPEGHRKMAETVWSLVCSAYQR